MSLDDGTELGFRIIWNEEEHGWQLVSTGRELSTTLIHQEVRRHAVLSGTMFNNMTTQLYSAEMALPAYQNAIFAEIKDGRTANAIFGAGGTGNMTPEAWARLETALAEEAGHLSNLAQGISDGSVSQLQARARAKQYAQAMEASYWDEWKQGLTSPELEHLPELPTVPGNGDTQCHGNCQCVLEFTERGVFWVLNPASHCDDCIDLADGSPYRGI